MFNRFAALSFTSSLKKHLLIVWCGLASFLLCQMPALAQSFEASGTWSSTWGPVTLNYDGVNRDGTQAIVGSWKEKGGNRGVITGGGYNRQNGNLWFEYYQPWNGVKGSANFALKNDGTVFDGSYHQANGTGYWTLTRPIQDSVAQVAPHSVASDDGDDLHGGRRHGRGKRRAGDIDGDGIPNKYDTNNNGAVNVATATNIDINGAWNSNFGAVRLNCESVRQDGTYRVNGTWNQGVGKVGQIQKGRYNPNDGSLWIKYFMPWKNLSGEANLKLKSRGHTLDGTWQQSDGSGTWTMTR